MLIQYKNLPVKSFFQQADQINVCADTSTCNYDSIQEAIDNAEANDIILLWPETFTETITIDKDLTIQGQENTIIQAHKDRLGASNRVVNITSGISVTIDGVTIRHGNAVGDHGGGILNHGTLTILDSLIINNNADNGGGRNC